MPRKNPPKTRLTKDEKDALKKNDHGKSFIVAFSKNPHAELPRV